MTRLPLSVTMKIYPKIGVDNIFLGMGKDEVRSLLGRLGSPKVQQCDSIDYHAYVALAVRGEASLGGC